MSAINSETAPYLAAFPAREGKAEPQWLTKRRAAAAERFTALGLPTRRDEAWRFTDLRPLQRLSFAAAPAEKDRHPVDTAPWHLSGPTHRLVLVNGCFVPELSAVGALPAGAWLATTAETLAQRPERLRPAFDATDETGAQAFSALNAALFTDGFVLALEDGVTLDRPVEVIHLGAAAAPHRQHLRSAVLMGAGSRASLIETFAGNGSYWTNAVVVIRLAEKAVLCHIRLQDEGKEAIHLAAARVTLAEAADYASFAMTLGARLSRQDTFVRLDGEGARCGLDGAYLLRGESEATTATFVDHAAPKGVTRELFKGVVDDRAHGVFLGRIGVRPEAQQTDAHQLNRNLLLSRRATVDTKPELEIFADDVKCSHGATVGDLDEAALFYLNARGIPTGEARRMLIDAFAAETLDRVEDSGLREHLARHLARWLGEGP